MTKGDNYNEKQIRILEISEALFAENGFDRTSIRTISKEAKINVAMISYYFGSKEKLLESLVHYRTSNLKYQLENLASEPLEPIEKIDQLIKLYTHQLNNNKGIYRILHFEFATGKGELRLEALSDLRKRNLKSLSTIIKEGQAKGVFRKDILIELISPTILGTFFHVVMNKVFFQELLSLDTDEKYNEYININLTKHIQQTIKALLIYEN